MRTWRLAANGAEGDAVEYASLSWGAGRQPRDRPSTPGSPTKFLPLTIDTIDRLLALSNVTSSVVTHSGHG